MLQWTWSLPAKGEADLGVSWLELSIALLLDDTILQQLHRELSGKGWPGPHSDTADPAYIFKALRTAARSAKIQRATQALCDADWTRGFGS